ncbi:MAG: site-specific integrase, partial [Candidatus Bathyarchaeia archaeon]
TRELGGVLTPSGIRAFLRARPQPKTRNNYLCVLRRFSDALQAVGVEARWLYQFEFAVPRKVYEKSVPSMDGLRRFDEALGRVGMNRGERHRLHLGERVLLLSRVTFLGLLSSGLRLAEFLGLRQEDVDFSTRMVRPGGRPSETTKRSLFSFLTREAMDALQAYRDRYPPGREGLLFLSRREVLHGTCNKVQNAFREASRLSGVRVNPHLLRSVFADRLGIVGIPDRFIDAFEGRLKDEELQRHYSDYRPEKLKVLHLLAEPHLTVNHPTDHIQAELSAAVQSVGEDLPYLLARLGLSPQVIETVMKTRDARHRNP